MLPTPEQLQARQVLVNLLRSPGEWPPGFRWDFHHTNTCAIGLCRRLFNFKDFAPYREEILGLDDRQASKIFSIYLAEILEITVAQVTSEHVAKALETA